MAGETLTVARPYAEAVFKIAVETDKLELWFEMLSFLAAVVRDPGACALTADPKIPRERITEFLLELGGGRLNDEGQNLVRLLVLNHRLEVLPEIAQLFEELKSEHEGTIDVEIASALRLNATQKRTLSDALEKRLGRKVRINARQDKSLIGGVWIRAGDLVIDGSVKGQLQQLAAQLDT